MDISKPVGSRLDFRAARKSKPAARIISLGTTESPSAGHTTPIIAMRELYIELTSALSASGSR